MKFQTPPPRTTAKGHMKCFQCRQALPMKEGGWLDRGSQQVFLCKPCQKLPSQPTQKASKLAKS